MLYAIVWFVVVSLLALWSLAAWALHALGVWTVSNAGALGVAAAGSAGLRWPAWLAPWVPPEITQSFAALLAAMEPVVQTLLQAAPAMASGLTAATWVVWVVGSVLLVVLGVAAHALIVIWRRRGGSSGSGPGPVLRAG